MIYRQEHPRPQFMRDNWVNLNGTWEFEIDHGASGIARKLFEKEHLDGTINVPFCPESKLSGVEYKDFMRAVWYRRDLTIPENWAGKRVILHFGAVDYLAIVYINGQKVGQHAGGYSSFEFDITDALHDGVNSLCVRAYDDTTSKKQPTGKQAIGYHSSGCYYTRTTGIWQTVWLEAVDPISIKSARYYPNISTASVDIELNPSTVDRDATVTAEAFFDGKPMGKASTKLDGAAPRLHIDLSESHLWDVGVGNLYDLTLTVEKNGKVLDTVNSYFGLREVGMKGVAFCVNGRPVFGRWVLDQGFYPDGVYTAPTDEDLKNDILYSLQLGFNGARLHEKIFEERFLYHADKLGYLVWGEFPNWGYDAQLASADGFLPEWIEAVNRDFNHPSIIGWCPFNETWNVGEGNSIDGGPNAHPQDKRLLLLAYRTTKAIDPTRPCIDTSGNYHCTETDMYDVHDYCQDVEKFAEYYSQVGEGIVRDQIERNEKLRPLQYPFKKGQPLFVSEYGGMRWAQEDAGWGYGNAPKTEEEFFARYKGLTDVLLDNPYILGFCYTQLYDVEQEQNGLMTYERKFKFDPQKFYEINTKKAAIEE